MIDTCSLRYCSANESIVALFAVTLSTKSSRRSYGSTAYSALTAVEDSVVARGTRAVHGNPSPERAVRSDYVAMWTVSKSATVTIRSPDPTGRGWMENMKSDDHTVKE